MKVSFYVSPRWTLYKILKVVPISVGYKMVPITNFMYNNKYWKGNVKMKKRFKVKLKEHLSGGIIKIVVDTETGVNYLMTSGLGLSGMTPLLDKDGKIVID